MIQALDMLNLIETQVEVLQLNQVVEALDVRNQVIVEVQLLQRRAQAIREIDRGNGVLAERQALAYDSKSASLRS